MNNLINDEEETNKRERNAYKARCIKPITPEPYSSGAPSRQRGTMPRRDEVSSRVGQSRSGVQHFWSEQLRNYTRVALVVVSLCSGF
jgi:hypothetical protein